jgi:predicted MPP superfamily phosphohydrolase
MSKDKKIDRRAFLREMFLLGTVAAVGIKAYIEPKSVEATYHQIKTDKLNDKIRVVHITDLHLDDDKSREYVPKMVNNCSPDIVVMTGDYLNSTEDNKIPVSRLEKYINKIKSKYGIYASFGNWDIGMENRLFKNTDVNTLRDSGLELKFGKDKINLYGLNYGNLHTYDPLLKNLDKSTFNLLLNHSPDLIEDIAQLNTIDLYLAGHTHGGQIRIPFFRLLQDGKGGFPYAGGIIPNYISKFGSKYQSGTYRVKDTILYVNRGVGMGDYGFGPKVRLFCRPEIATFDIGPDRALEKRNYTSSSNL